VKQSTQSFRFCSDVTASIVRVRTLCGLLRGGYRNDFRSGGCAVVSNN